MQSAKCKELAKRRRKPSREILSFRLPKLARQFRVIVIRKASKGGGGSRGWT